MGLFSIFNIGLQSLNAYSAGMNVTANNIANANDPNYSRQRVSFTTLTPDSLGGVELGRGLFLSGVDQVVDNFLEARILDGNMDFGQWEARADYLRSVEGVFNELDGNGLNDAVGAFFDAWGAVAAEPQSLPVRNNLLNSAQTMIDKFDQYSTALDDIQGIVDEEIRAAVPILDNILTEIKGLNDQIRESPVSDLAYRDQRRGLLGELSKWMDINVIEDYTTGEVQVYTKSGIPLVSGQTVATFSTVPNPANNNFLDIQTTVGSTTTAINNELQQGRLRGLIDIRDTDIEGYLDDLDNMAYSLMTEINALHNNPGNAFDLNGVDSNDFFTDLGVAPGGVVNAAQNLSLSAAVLGNPDAIAVSDDAAELPGNNNVALAIVALGTSSSIDFDHGAGTDNNSYVGFFGQFLTDVGSDTLLAKNNEDFHNNLLTQVKLERESKSGVNIDEEEVNMIKFQSAISASSRLVKVAEEVLDSILGML